MAIFLKTYYKEVVAKWEMVFIYHQKNKVRSHRKKAKEEITLASGKYIHDFIIALTFVSGGKKLTRVIDFLPLFQQYVKGNNLQYFAPANFKKFIIKNGNIYWGKGEDVIFPTSMFLRQKKSAYTSEEILYII